MRLRTRPALFNRLFVDAVTTRPFLRDLLDQRRAAGPLSPAGDAGEKESDAEVVVALPRAA